MWRRVRRRGFVEKTGGVELCHAQVLVQEVSAFGGFRSRNFAFVGKYETAHCANRVRDVLRCQIAEHQKITARSATHGAEVYDVVRRFRIAEKGCAQVFYRVQSGGVHDGFAVGRGEAEVEGGDGDSVTRVLARNVKPGQKFEMIYCETCDFFHNCLRNDCNTARAVTQQNLACFGQVVRKRFSRRRFPLFAAFWAFRLRNS